MGDGENFRVIMYPSSEFVIRLHPVHAPLQSFQSSMRCSFGKQEINVPTVVDPSVPRDAVFLTSRVAQSLRCRQFDGALTAFVVDNRLHIGPTIGIMCNPRWDPKTRTLSPSKQLPAMKKLLDAGEAAGALCFLFRVEDVDLARSLVKGYRSTGDGFAMGTFPLPDVIYDQIVSRKVERNLQFMEKRRAISLRYGVKIFNDGFFDKWQVHEWLTEDVKLRPHVPETNRFTTQALATSFIQRHAMTYIKPVHGSLGLGIIRVIKNPDGSISYDLKRREQEPLHGKCANPGELIRVFQKRLKSRPYLLQQGIFLASYRERPFDIRIIAQRDETGVWRRTKMFARVAKSGDITSNLSSGGEALPVSAVFKEIYKRTDEQRKIQKQIRVVTQNVTDCLEKQSGKQFGELGIDLGVDHMGHVWIIEVNSKPWKSPTTEKGRQDLVDLAFERPIRYAIYLSRQK